jgi:signal transduction histidine kinase
MILDEGIGGEIPPQAKGFLEKIYSASQRLAAMVKDLLNVSRIESGRIHLIYEQKPIEGLIDQAIGEILSKAKEVNQTLTFDKPTKAMPLTWFDVTRIIEVLINMIGNSIKYTQPGGKIEVSVSADTESITVAVEDNGRGIPKEKQDQVFSKFTQVDVLKDEVKGTGLGMYISKRFIELHKGKIWFESDGENKGTSFYFSLPIIKEKPVDPHEGEGAVLH